MYETKYDGNKPCLDKMSYKKKVLKYVRFIRNQLTNGAGKNQWIEIKEDWWAITAECMNTLEGIYKPEGDAETQIDEEKAWVEIQ